LNSGNRDGSVTDCEVCDRCKTKQTAMKQMSIRRLPLILSLHVKRFEQTDGKVGSQLTMFPHFTYKSLRTYICSNRHSSLQTYILRTCTEFSQTSYVQILNIVPHTLLEQMDGKVCPQPTAFLISPTTLYPVYSLS
jgi:hypothetical protein